MRLSGDENAGAKRMDEGTDECAAEGVGSAMLRRIKRQKDDTPAPPALGSHPVFQISDDDDVENDENAVQLMDEAPLPAIVKPPPPGALCISATLYRIIIWMRWKAHGVPLDTGYHASTMPAP